MRFGNVAIVAALVALSWPLVFSWIVPDGTAIIVAYVVAFVLDAVLIGVWFALALRYSTRAARGDAFTIAWLARITGSRAPTA